MLCAILLGGGSRVSDVSAASFSWNLNANGNWNSSANWNPNTSFANAIDDVASFGSVITAARTITLGQNIILGQINFNGANNYTIAGANTLTFDVSIGRASINVNNTLGNGAHAISAGVSLNDSLDLVQNSTGNFTMSGVISGANGITKTGTGVLILSGANTFSGGLTLSAGTLSIGNNSAAGTGTLTLGGGTIQANSATARTIANAVNLSGGSGTLILGAANSFTGGLTLSAGTLSAAHDNAFGPGSVNLSGGTLRANHFAEMLGTLSLNANSILQMGTFNGTAKDLVFSSATRTGGLLSIANWTGTTSGGTADRVFITSQPNAAFLQNVTFSGFAAGAQWNGLSHEIVPVPEPQATVLAVFAVLFLLAARLRKKFSSV